MQASHTRFRAWCGLWLLQQPCVRACCGLRLYIGIILCPSLLYPIYINTTPTHRQSVVPQTSYLVPGTYECVRFRVGHAGCWVTSSARRVHEANYRNREPLDRENWRWNALARNRVGPSSAKPAACWPPVKSRPRGWSRTYTHTRLFIEMSCCTILE